MKIYHKLCRSTAAKLYRHLTKRHRRPVLPGGLITMYDKSKLSDDEKIIMMMGGAKDQLQAQEALEGYATAMDWIRAQPRKTRNVRARLMAWIRRALGVYEYDPIGKLEPPTSKRLRVNYRLESDDQL